MDKVVDRFFGTPPFDEYKDFFNIFRIDVISNESGVNHPQTANDENYSVPLMVVDNYFGSSFDRAGIHRLLSPSKYNKVIQVLAANVPDYDQIFVVVNTSYFGGAGGAFATFSMHSSAGNVAMHELGHSFAKLADEYSSAGGSPREAANTTMETRRELIKWNYWIEDSIPIPTPGTQTEYNDVIGLFEGAAYRKKDWYRPKYNCKMRSSGRPFCEVCAEAIINKIYDLVDPVDSFSPAEQNVNIDGGDIEFTLDLIQTESKTIRTEWFLNDDFILGNASQYQMNQAELTGGLNELAVMVLDTTDMVRDEEHRIRHMSVIKWAIDKTTSVNINSMQSRIKMSAWPNPFTDRIVVEYAIDTGSEIDIDIVGLTGEVIFFRSIGHRPSGSYREEINLNKDVGSGMYILRLKSGRAVIPIKLVRR